MTSYLNIVSSSSWLLISFSSVFHWQLWFQKDVKLLDDKTRSSLEAKMLFLGDKLGIKKNLVLTEVQDLMSGAQHIGNNFFQGPAYVAINPEVFNDISIGSQEFILSHELSHIQNGDMLSLGLIASAADIITNLAIAILLPHISPVTPNIMIYTEHMGTLIGFIALVFFSQKQEKCADLSAMSICSKEGQEAAPRLFKLIQEKSLAYRNNPNISFLSSLWRKILFTSEGEHRLDVFHPSLKARINYLKPC